jgi:hypothetical protein
MRSRAGSSIGRLRAALDRSLFPPARADALRFRGWEGFVVGIAFLALAAALQFLRAGPTESPKALFAEDGGHFLSWALTHGFLDSITSTYAEYMVFLPSLSAEIATIGPLRYAPEVMNLGAVLLVAISALAVWVASAGLVRNTYLRVLLVALVLVPTASGLETVVSATNVAWYTAFAVFWLLLWRPEADWSAALGALLILATGLSSPTIFFFVPVAALRAIAIRDRRDALLVGAFALALAIQLPVTAFGSEHVTDPEWTANIFTTFMQRVPLGVALGLDLGGEAWEAWGWGALIVCGLAVAAALTALAIRASAGRLFALVSVATALVMFFGSSYTRGLGDEMVWPQNLFTPFGGRYAMIPVLLIAGAAIVLADSRLRGPRPSHRPALATAAVLLVGLVTSFGGDAHREMPSWANSLREGAANCRSEGGTDATVFITPEGWTMGLPCELLESEYPAVSDR